jgi:hypothetical protein
MKQSSKYVGGVVLQVVCLLNTDYKGKRLYVCMVPVVVTGVPQVLCTSTVTMASVTASVVWPHSYMITHIPLVRAAAYSALHSCTGTC